MSEVPEDQIRSVPVAEIVPGNLPPDQPHPLPATVIPLRKRRSRLPVIVGLATALILVGAALWYWWISGPPPIQYKTAAVDRGPITAIVTATGTVNPVVSVQVGSQVRPS